MGDSLYRQLARHRPNAVRLGGSIITMVEPVPGRAEAYNRWYEDDHFYAGAMMGPWVFAGRRFERLPLNDSELAPTRDQNAGGGGIAGRFITLYWIADGHVDDVEEWSLEILQEELVPAGRGSVDRRHLYTAFHAHAFSHIFDEPPVRDVHALDHPYGGLIVEIIDATSPTERHALVSWLQSELMPAAASIAVAQCVAFVPKPFDPSLAGDYASWAQLHDPAGRVCLLWFLRDEPSEELMRWFEDHREDVADSRWGKVDLIAPYRPVFPGARAAR